MKPHRTWVALSWFVLAWLGVLHPSPSSSWPVLDELKQPAGVRVYPDHEDPALFWAVARRFEIPPAGQANSFHFERYRQVGREVTGDAGARWTRGTLSFSMRLRATPERLEAAERELERELRRNVVIKPLPLESMETRVLYPTPTAGDEAERIAGRFAALRKGVWTEERVVIGMDEATTEALWASFELGKGGIRVASSLYAQALATRPLDAITIGDEEISLEKDARPEPSLVAHEVLPVDATPATCAPCFETTVLSDVDDRGFPVLHVYTDELAEEEGELARLIVEVEATASDGSKAPLDVAFRPGGESLASLRFRHPVRVDAGYRARLIRIHHDGSTEEGTWTKRRFGPLFDASPDDESDREPDPEDTALDSDPH